ncbi:hypothetical protein Scep_010272 [Stephania cephalantha]|uniref:Uncharacterized protein n=1 Tax=Stephania cephalantha TaxID=152367 RepID=A0AAP0PH27_9MAGN
MQWVSRVAFYCLRVWCKRVLSRCPCSYKVLRPYKGSVTDVPSICMKSPPQLHGLSTLICFDLNESIPWIRIEIRVA